MNGIGASLAPLVNELVTANRILANEGVLDGFGHVSVRDPGEPGHYLLSRSRSAGMVDDTDIHAFDLNSRPLSDIAVSHYSERVIHGCAYAARPDVMAVCHFHAPALLPFANTGAKIVPVLHLGALMGHDVPVWDARDEFGNTNMLVTTVDEGCSLARALAGGWSLIMRRHGAVVVGRSLREMVFRAIVLTMNAEVQLRAQSLGAISPLNDAEIEMSAEANLQPSVQQRVWDYWSARLPSASTRSMPTDVQADVLLAAVGS